MRRINEFIFTPTGQRSVLSLLIGISALLPILLQEYLSPIIILGPVLIIIGTFLVGNQTIQRVPHWVVLNATSVIVVAYSAYAIGITLSLQLVMVFAIGLFIYDIVAVKLGAMQGMSESMLPKGLPITFLIPHNQEFSYGKFSDVIENNGLAGLHESDQGVMMLGIGDVVIPTAIALSAGQLGTNIATNNFIVTIPQISILVGGLLGLGLLVWARLPRAIAALTVSVPGSLLGLAVGYLLDPKILLTI